MQDEGATPIGRRDDRGGIARQVDHRGSGVPVERHDAESVPPPAGHEEGVSAGQEGGGHGLLRHRDGALDLERSIDRRHSEDANPGIVGSQGDDASGRRHEHGRGAGADWRGREGPERLDIERHHDSVVGVGYEGEGAVAEPGEGHGSSRSGAGPIDRCEGQPRVACRWALPGRAGRRCEDRRRRARRCDALAAAAGEDHEKDERE